MSEAIKMFESQVTGECGNLFYVARNLVGRSYEGKLFLNLRWAHYTYNEDGIWVREPYVKSLYKFIKQHICAQIFIALAALGDIYIWLNIFGII